MLNPRERGQSLLETLIVIAVILAAVGIATASFRFLAVNGHANATRLIALEAAQNAATELLAAAAYDPDAVAHLSGLQWQVVPPAPPPGSPASESAPIVLTSSVHAASGQSGTAQLGSLQSTSRARNIIIHYSVDSVQGDLALTLRALTIPPGSVIDARVSSASP